MPSIKTFLYSPLRRSQSEAKSQAAQLPLDTKKHNPASFQHLDLRGKFNKEKQDVLMGRVQWSLEDQLNNPNFKGNQKDLSKRINKLQEARTHLSSIPNDKISSGDIAILEKSLRKAADVLPNSPQKTTISMMATYMAAEWGQAKRAQVAKNVAKEQHFLKDDGAQKSQAHSVSLGVKTNFVETSVGVGTNSKSSIDHMGAHLSETNKKRFGRIKLGGSLGAAKANVSAAAAHSTLKKSSEAYSGGTQDYVKQEGYKQYFSSKRADAKVAKLRKNVNANPSVPTPSTPLENAAVASLRPEAKIARKVRPLTMIGVKNDLAADGKTQQQAANQASLFTALLSSELGLDVNLPSSAEAQDSRTKLTGRSYETSVKAYASVGAKSVEDSIGMSANISAKAKFVKKQNAYIKYEPMWQTLKGQSGATSQQTPVMEQRTDAVLKQAQSYAKHHPELLPTSAKTLNNASDKELMKALKTLEADVDNYVSYKKIMSHQGSKKAFSGAMKQQVHQIEKNYGVSSSKLKGIKASEEFIKAATLIQTAIGAQLIKRGSLKEEGMTQLDGLDKKLRNPSIPINHDKILDSTHFSSKSELNSTTRSSTFKLNYGGELPEIASGMPSWKKSKGISVEVARTKQTEHPDRLSRGEKIDVTVNIPGVPSPKTLETIAASVAQKIGVPSAADAILSSLSNAVSIDTDSDGKLSVVMRFTKPTLDKEEGKKFKLEYATARVAVQNTHQRASLSARVAGLPVSPTLGLERHKESIVPIATYYGDGSFKNIVRSYNETHTSDAASAVNWAEQKSKRQPALDRILVSMGKPQNENRQMMEKIFDEIINDAPTEQKANIKKKKESFFSLAEQVIKAPKNSDDLKELTGKMNNEFEEMLAMQHETWLSSTSGEMKEQPYK